MTAANISAYRPPPKPVTAADRLGLTLFLAIALHALVILGISFSSNDGQKPKIVSTLDITLVQHSSENKPKEADYLAQANLKGSGNTRKQVRNTGPQKTASLDRQKGLARKNQPAPYAPAEHRRDTRVVTGIRSDFKVNQQEKKKKESLKTPSVAELMRRSMEIARLTAKNDAEWKAYSRMPDSKYIYANTRKHVDAAYLADWSSKVEKFGNLNYPDEARRRNLSGNLIMEVALRDTGQLESIRILNSSGHKILDDAAIRIVKLAAPYSQVPREVMEGRKVLRIVRTWSFTTDNELFSR